MADVLQSADLGIGPSGEVRWRTVALKERRALDDAGLVTSGGPGLWELTTQGYETLEVFRAAQAEAAAGSEGGSPGGPDATSETAATPED